MGMVNKDRRKSKRRVARNTFISLRPLDPQVWFRFWSGTECSMRDISLVGAGVTSREKLPVGTPLSIDLRLGKNTSSIRIFGKVAWISREDGDNYRAGISFSWWKDDQEKKSLDEFLERLAPAL